MTTRTAVEDLVDLSREDSAVLIQDTDRLFAAMGTQPDLRRIVALRLAFCSVREIAERVELPPHIVRRHLRQAAVLLRESRLIDRIEPDPDAPSPRRLARRFDHTPGRRSAEPLASTTTDSQPRPGSDLTRSGRPRPRSRARTAAASSAAPARRTQNPLASLRASQMRARLWERRSRPLTALESYGWRDVYYSEVHRLGQRPR
jgi:hypothetical protein